MCSRIPALSGGCVLAEVLCNDRISLCRTSCGGPHVTTWGTQADSGQASKGPFHSQPQGASILSISLDRIKGQEWGVGSGLEVGVWVCSFWECGAQR